MAKQKFTSSGDTETTLQPRDADDAWEAFATLDRSVVVLDDAIRKRLLRKIDLMLMPVILLAHQGGLSAC